MVLGFSLHAFPCLYLAKASLVGIISDYEARKFAKDRRARKRIQVLQVEIDCNVQALLYYIKQKV